MNQYWWVLTVLLVLCCLWASIRPESFISHFRTRRIDFLSPRQGCWMIRQWNLPYFSILNGLDRKARHCYGYNCAQIYCRRVMAFTHQERHRLTGIISYINALLSPILSKKFEKDWRLIKVRDNFEGGLPHTIGNSVVLPRSVLSLNNKQIAIILLHEQVHVFQKQFYPNFLSLYIEYWPFRAISAREVGKLVPKRIRHRIRTNPDGLNLGWLFPLPGRRRGQNWVLPLCLYKNPSDPKLGVTEYRGLLVRALLTHPVQYRLRSVHPIFLSELPAYQQYFGIATNHYHPNEISATLLEQKWTNQLYPGTFPANHSQANQQLDRWLMA